MRLLINIISIIFISFLIFFFSYNVVECKEINSVTIRGRVLDIDDFSPLPGASIRARNEDYGAITDENGSFRFELPENERYELECSYIGYNTERLIIYTEEDYNFNITFYLISTEITTEIVTKYHETYKRYLNKAFERYMNNKGVTKLNWLFGVGPIGSYHFEKKDNVQTKNLGYGVSADLRLIFGYEKEESHLENGITLQFNFNKAGLNYKNTGELEEDEIGVNRDYFTLSTNYSLYLGSIRSQSNTFASPYINIGLGISYVNFEEYKGTYLRQIIDTIKYERRDKYEYIGMVGVAEIGYINAGKNFSWGVSFSCQSANILESDKFPIYISLKATIGTVLL